MADKIDGIFIGGGHNSLVGAANMAKSEFKKFWTPVKTMAA
jgi:phytoene dehydrogenase-like protein